MSAAEQPSDWPATAIAVQSASRSHVGLVRQINEDRVFDWADGRVWAVADGMGGHRGGDLAAQSVVDALRDLQNSGKPATPAVILAALECANTAIHDRNAAEREQAGATVVALSFCGDVAHLAWAGDSRCYRVRDRAAQLLSRDHSVVQELVDAGLLTPEAAARHPQANVITRALGVEATCDVETSMVDCREGDLFLLCSDGLSRSLQEHDLVSDDVSVLADALLARALERDGTDNISLALVRFGVAADLDPARGGWDR